MTPGKLGKIAVWIMATIATALAQPSALVSSGPRLIVPNAIDKRVPVWGGNAILVADGSSEEPSSFLAFDRSGNLVFNSGFSIPDAAHTNVYSYARGGDGTVALCGVAFASDGRRAPYVAWIAADGSAQHVIRTEPYTPNLISIAPDGTLWTVGYELNAEAGEESGVDPNAGVLRHFERSGKAIAAYIPRSSIGNSVLLDSINGFLSSSSDRVGWLVTWEIPARGLILNCWPTAPFQITPFLVCPIGIRF